MEWKIIVGQLCLTAVAVTCLVQGVNHGLVYASLGALAASIGIPALVAAKEGAAS